MVESEEQARGMQTRTARLLIADDHDLVRDGFHRMLGREPDLEVVGEASNGREAVELCRRLNPDLVLMDVRMPEMDGLEATRTIKEEQPLVSVLVVTTYENPDYLLGAIKAGAAGYVLKDAPKRQLVNAVRRVLEGESPINQELAAQLIRRLADEATQYAQEPPPSLAPEKRVAAKPPIEELTPRELEVLALLTQGKTNPQIAEALVISRATAKVHVERIIRKLGVSDRTQAVVRAIDLGLVKPETVR
jgi:DNA-binding NarL/FixJ family response regulator